jgi:hypothetical protein
MFSEMMMMEKKDACYYKVKASAKVWPSAYASGRLVQCRKKGAGNYGNKSEGKINEFAPPGGDDRGPGDEEILRRLAAQWWSGTEQQMIKAQQTLEALGWEIGPDESGDDDAGVYVYRIGDNDGRDTLAFGHNELSLDEGVAEGKIKLSTDPNWYGAEVGDYKASGPVVNIPSNQLVGFEPDDKMNQTASKANVEKIVAGLKQGAKLPPLMVRKYQNGYQVLDGHHRFWAYKLLGVKSIPAQIVPAEDVEEIGQQGVAEGGVLGFMAQNKPRIKKSTSLSTMRKEFEKEKTAEPTNYVLGKDLPKNPQHVKTVRAAEGYNPEYDDEAGMADNNLETLDRAVEGIDRLIDSGDNLPEWCQEKIAVAKSMLVSVWDYMYSEEASDEVDPEVDEMFEAMDQLAEEMAAKNGVSADLVWEQFEALSDQELYETAAWRRKEGKNKKGGLNAKGVASYRRENPGSKLQTAVTTKPSKLKPGSKAAKRRKSFCARMGGVKGPMKKPNGKPTRKALALRKWNC